MCIRDRIICDALNGLAYKDDAQVVELQVHKRFSETPGVTAVSYTHLAGVVEVTGFEFQKVNFLGFYGMIKS